MLALLYIYVFLLLCILANAVAVGDAAPKKYTSRHRSDARRKKRVRQQAAANASRQTQQVSASIWTGPSYKFFADYASGSCLQDCMPGPFGCSIVPPPIVLYDTIDACCSVGQTWVDNNYCRSRSQGTYTNLWYVDYASGSCRQDTGPQHDDGSLTLYNTVNACCQAKLGWADMNQCVGNAQFSVPYSGVVQQGAPSPAQQFLLVENRIQVALSGVSSGYTLQASAIQSTVGYIRSLLETNLSQQQGVTLLDVQYAGEMNCQALPPPQNNNNGGIDMYNNNGIPSPGATSNSCCLGATSSLPMQIKVSVPSNLADSASSSILQVLQSRGSQITTFIKALDSFSLGNSNVQLGSYEPSCLGSAPSPPSPQQGASPSEQRTLNVETRVQVALSGVSSGYRLSASAIQSTVGYVRQLLQTSLVQQGITLVGVQYAGEMNCQTPAASDSCCLGATSSLPMAISVSVPSNLADSASSSIIQVLQSRGSQITTFIKSLDSFSLGNSNVQLGSYEPSCLGSAPSPPIPPPAPRPTVNGVPSPTIGGPQESQPSLSGSQPSSPSNNEPIDKTVPMQINLDNVGGATRRLQSSKKSYLPTAEDIEFIIETYNDIIKENLPRPLKLVGMSRPDKDTPNRHLEVDIKNSLYLPVDVTVDGPKRKIDEIYPELMKIIAENKDEITEQLKEYDPEAFGNVEASSEFFDSPDISSSAAITTHPVQFHFNNVAKGYEMDKYTRESFINYIDELMIETMRGGQLKMFQVAYSSRFERDDAPVPILPVRITVRSPQKVDEDEALEIIMGALKVLKKDFTKKLKSLDQNSFDKVSITFDSRDLPDVTVTTFVTEHAVSLIIKNAPADYNLTPDIETKLMSYVKDYIKEEVQGLDSRFELVQLSDTGRVGSVQKDGTLTIPIIAAVRGPEDAPHDELASYVTELVYELDLQEMLAKWDPTLKDVTGAAEEYSFGSLMETVHYVKVHFRNAPKGFLLSDDHKADLMRFLKRLLTENLADNVSLVEMKEMGYDESSSLLLQITAEGPADTSDFVLTYIMSVFDEEDRDIQAFFKSMNWNEHNTMVASFEEYNPDAERDEWKETEHQIKLSFSDVPSGYIPEEAIRAAMIRLCKGLLDDYLHQDYMLVDVKDAGYINEPSLPLKITVMGPSHEDPALARAHVLETLYAHKPSINSKLKTLEFDTFKNGYVTIETYDFLGNTLPRPVPLEGQESPYDTPASTISPLGGQESDPSEQETTGAFPSASAAPSEGQETSHPVQMITSRSIYSLSESDKKGLIRLIKDKLSLDDVYELIDVADLSRSRLLREGRRVLQYQATSLPLLVRVNGPEDTLDDFDVIQALRDIIPDIERFLQDLDEVNFRNVVVSFEPYDDVTPDALDATETTMPGWAAIPIVLAILIAFCCFACCCLARYRYRKHREAKEKVIVEKVIEEKESIATTSHTFADENQIVLFEPAETLAVFHDLPEDAYQYADQNQSLMEDRTRGSIRSAPFIAIPSNGNNGPCSAITYDGIPYMDTPPNSVLLDAPHSETYNTAMVRREPRQEIVVQGANMLCSVESGSYASGSSSKVTSMSRSTKDSNSNALILRQEDESKTHHSYVTEDHSYVTQEPGGQAYHFDHEQYSQYSYSTNNLNGETAMSADLSLPSYATEPPQTTFRKSTETNVDHFESGNEYHHQQSAIW